MLWAGKFLLAMALIPCVSFANWLPIAPKNFTVQRFAEIEDARSIAIASNQHVFISTRRAGKVWFLQDENGDGIAETKQLVADGLDMPNGIALCGQALFVVTNTKVIRFPSSPPFVGRTIFDQLPNKRHHGWRYVVCDGTKHLIISIGVPCNICTVDKKKFGILARFDIHTKQLDVLATGVRNAVGMAWHPQKRVLWFTDNGRDWMGDDLPPDELNKLEPAVTKKSVPHFGFPYIHSRSVIDPVFGPKRPKTLEVTPPVWEFPAHVAPLGLTFVNNDKWRDNVGDILVAQHGSWNRSEKTGYQVVALRLDGERVTNQTIFLHGFLENKDNVHGRPVDLKFMPNGTLLVSDDAQGAVYAIRLTDSDNSRIKETHSGT